MDNIRFLFDKDDIELKEDIEKTFGKDITYSEEFDFIGETIAVIIIPATGLAIQILDFVLTHVVKHDDSSSDTKKKSKKKNKKDDVKRKRKIEFNGQRISLSGDFTAEEIVKILRSLGLEEK